MRLTFFNRICSSYLVLAVLTMLYVVIFSVLATREHWAFETSAFDLGVYDQALWNASQGRGLALTLVPFIGPNRFAIHVEPILFLLVPLYWFWPTPLWLLWVQTLALGLAGWPLFLLARRRLSSDMAALVIVIAYFLLPATEAVNLFDFHAVALSPPLMFAALYFLDKALASSGNGSGLWHWPRLISPIRVLNQTKPLSLIRDYVLSAIFFLLTLSTKEDISLHVVMIGLYVMLIARRWKPGVLLTLVGTAWFFMAFYLIIPANRIEGKHTSAYVDFFHNLGDTPLEIALSPIHSPSKVLALVFTPQNIREWSMILAPFGFVGLIGFPFLLLATPTLAITMLSSNPLMQQLETWHYAAPLLPFITLAAIDGLARLSYLITKRQNRKFSDIGLSFPVSTSPLIIFSLLLLISSLIYHYFRGYSPLARPFRWPEIMAHHAVGEKITALIPPEVNVIAQAELVPRVSHRQKVEVWTGPLNTDADFIFLDVAHPAFVNRNNAQGELLTGMVIEPSFGLIAANNGYLLLQRGAPRLPISKEFYSFVFASQEAVVPQTSVVFGDEIELITVDTFWQRQADENVNEPQVILTFRVLAKPTEDYNLVLYRVNEVGRLEGATIEQAPALIWWPTGRWMPGDLIKVRVTPFWWTGDSYVFGYALGFVRGDKRWNLSARLPITAHANNIPISIQENLALIAGFHRLWDIPYPDDSIKFQLAKSDDSIFRFK